MTSPIPTSGRPTTAELDFLSGGGEMGALMRSHDWRNSPMGPPEQWPLTLKTFLRLLLSSAQPMFIWWGAERIQFYNDSFRESMGPERHPRALGQSGIRWWGDIWRSLGPEIDAVMAGKGSTWHHDEMIAFTRHGRYGDTWWNYSFSPISDESGVHGVLVICNDVTEQHRNQEALKQSYHALVESMDEGFCVAEVIFDDEGEPVDFVFQETNLAFEQQSGLTGAVGKSITQLVPGMEKLWVQHYGQVVSSGEPTRFVAEAKAMGRWFDVYAMPSGNPDDNLVAILFQDISEDKRTEAALRTSRARAEIALSIAELGTFEWDLQSGQVALSERSRAMFALHDEGPVTAEQIFARIAQDDLERIKTEIHVGLMAEGKMHNSYRIILPDGTSRHIESFGSAERGAGGEWARIIGVLRDVTESRKSEQALLEASRRKDEFLAMLAHELRNPLAPISAAADLLTLVSADATLVKKTSATISRQVRHMTSLIDDLLDVSRVTRGLVSLDKSVLDAKRIVADAVEQVRPLMESRRHRFTLQMPPVPTFVLGDSKRLVQVLTNLLNNAAKYTPPGGAIRMQIDASVNKIALTVADNGIGMTPEMTERAFELFEQAERTVDRSQGGLGLGLALVKSLVALHHGEVSARSPGLGQGSTFTVELPRVDTLAPSALPEALAPPPASKHALRLLIVDDNADAATMLAMYLEAAGHTVMIENDSMAALERAAADRPDACLLDIGLPGMDGNELARRLRANPATARAVLVAITGYGQEQDRKNALAAGFDHHFVKPVDTQRLGTLLASLGGLA